VKTNARVQGSAVFMGGVREKVGVFEKKKQMGEQGRKILI